MVPGGAWWCLVVPGGAWWWWCPEALCCLVVPFCSTFCWGKGSLNQQQRVPLCFDQPKKGACFFRCFFGKGLPQPLVCLVRFKTVDCESKGSTVSSGVAVWTRRKTRRGHWSQEASSFAQVCGAKGANKLSIACLLSRHVRMNLLI